MFITVVCIFHSKQAYILYLFGLSQEKLEGSSGDIFSVLCSVYKFLRTVYTRGPIVIPACVGFAFVHSMCALIG